MPSQLHWAMYTVKLLARDRYRCIATGKIDASHPDYQDRNKRKSVRLFVLIGCHILRRATAIFDAEKDTAAVRLLSYLRYRNLFNSSNQYYSAVTTFDILRNYANLPAETIEALRNVIDHPSNGFLLESNAHTGYDLFEWCLKKTDVSI
jgi:hypothetical protein